MDDVKCKNVGYTLSRLKRCRSGCEQKYKKKNLISEGDTLPMSRNKSQSKGTTDCYNL